MILVLLILKKKAQ